MPDFHGGPCANAVRIGRRPLLHSGDPQVKDDALKEEIQTGMGRFLHRPCISQYACVEASHRQAGANEDWDSGEALQDLKRRKATVPRPNFDDGPINWPAGVTKPISSAWQPLPADNLQANFSIDVNDQRCIHIMSRHLKEQPFPTVLIERNMILDAYPNWKAANIPERLAGKCMWGWLQYALQRTATFATVAKRAKHLNDLRAKMLTDTYGILGTLYPQVMQRRPEQPRRKEILLDLAQRVRRFENHQRMDGCSWYQHDLQLFSLR